MAKTPKLKFKPTPISRLFKYQTPIKMVGDPDYNRYGRKAWANREKAVYAHMMEHKHWPMPWSPETWEIARQANNLLDDHIRVKWVDYVTAIADHADYQYEEALKDNAAWDYHHENFLAA